MVLLICPRLVILPNAHLNIAIWNFGIQEFTYFTQEEQEIFPGCPTVENGYMYVSEKPGLGIDIDENLAAQFPIPTDHITRSAPKRYSDGTIRR